MFLLAYLLSAQLESQVAPVAITQTVTAVEVITEIVRTLHPLNLDTTHRITMDCQSVTEVDLFDSSLSIAMGLE